MEVALYFGSFNPPHCGHAAIAEHLYRKSGFDEVRIVLSPQNPLKERQSESSEELRLEMVRQWVGTVTYLRLCTLEFEMERPSYTYLTLRRLREMEPQNRFSLVIGADSLAAFRNWREWEEIAHCHQLVVYPREGYDIMVLKEALQRVCPEAAVTCLDAPLCPFSSTAVRDAVAAGEDASGMVPPVVWQFILNGKLYKESH